MRALAPMIQSWAKRPFNLAALVLLSCFLSGCMHYHYMGKTYGSQDEVFAAQTELYESAIARIPRRRVPLAPRAFFGIPRREVVQERGLDGLSPAARDWIAELLGRVYRYTAQAIVHRGLFTELAVEETKGGHLVLEPSEIAIYLYLEAPNVSGWYLRRGNAPPTPIFFDSGKSDLAARIMFFLNSIERLLVQGEADAARPGVLPVKAAPPSP